MKIKLINKPTKNNLDIIHNLYLCIYKNKIGWIVKHLSQNRIHIKPVQAGSLLESTSRHTLPFECRQKGYNNCVQRNVTGCGKHLKAYIFLISRARINASLIYKCINIYSARRAPPFFPYFGTLFIISINIDFETRFFKLCSKFIRLKYARLGIQILM